MTQTICQSELIGSLWWSPELIAEDNVSLLSCSADCLWCRAWLQGRGLSRHQRNISAFTGITTPVPVEHAFPAENEIVWLATEIVQGSQRMGLYLACESYDGVIFYHLSRPRMRTSCCRADRFRSKIGVELNTESSLFSLSDAW